MKFDKFNELISYVEDEITLHHFGDIKFDRNKWDVYDGDQSVMVSYFYEDEDNCKVSIEIEIEYDCIRVSYTIYQNESILRSSDTVLSKEKEQYFLQNA